MVSKIEVDEISNQSGDQDSGVDLSTNDVVAVKTANTERMRVDASGNVGIGTSSMGSETFVVEKSSGTPTIRINAPSGSEAQIKLQGDGTITDTQLIASKTDGSLAFSRWTGSAFEERMRIDSSGNVLIGGNSAVPSGSVGGSAFEPAGDNRMILSLGCTTTSNRNVATFRNSNNLVGTINVSGSSTGFNTSSDYRLKENVVTDWDATTRLKQLKPSRFNFKTDKDTTVDGFLAHEVSSIVPEATTGKKDEVDADGNPVYQGIDQSKLVPLLTKALQEAVAKIETLEAKVTALESK